MKPSLSSALRGLLVLLMGWLWCASQSNAGLALEAPAGIAAAQTASAPAADSTIATPASRKSARGSKAMKPKAVKPSPVVIQEPVPPPAPPTPGKRPAVPAVLRISNGNITIVANNASLVQTLHALAIETGMETQIDTTDERIFGTFGPAPISKVLVQLLDGTGSNYMLLGEDPETKGPRSLVVTPRNTSSSPLQASVKAPVDDSDSDTDTPTPTPVPAPRPFPGRRFGGVPPNANAATANAGTAPDSPDATDTTKTPQQIIDDFQRRRAERLAQQPPQQNGQQQSDTPPPQQSDSPQQ